VLNASGSSGRIGYEFAPEWTRIDRYSHARASNQRRLTVAGDGPQRGRRVLDRHPSEETALDDVTQGGVVVFEVLERGVEGHEDFRLLWRECERSRHRIDVRERHPCEVATALLTQAIAGIVAEDMSHGFGSHAEEMSSASANCPGIAMRPVCR
jgi:hypothetical protein